MKAWGIAPGGANEKPDETSATLDVNKIKDRPLMMTRADAHLKWLLTVAPAKRTWQWQIDFQEALPHTTFEGLDRTPAPGPSWLDCLHSEVARSEGAGMAFTDILDQVLEAGVGLAVASGRSKPGEASFGAIATYKMFQDWRSPVGWSGGTDDDDGSEILGREERLEIRAPDETYLPPFVRNAVRRHLEAGGVKKPKVLLIVRPERSNRRDLVFSFERADFPAREAYNLTLESLSWYLPQGYRSLPWDAGSGSIPSTTSAFVPL